MTTFVLALYVSIIRQALQIRRDVASLYLYMKMAMTGQRRGGAESSLTVCNEGRKLLPLALEMIEHHAKFGRLSIHLLSIEDDNFCPCTLCQHYSTGLANQP